MVDNLELWDKELQLISKPVWLLHFYIIWKKVMKIFFFLLAIQLKSTVVLDPTDLDSLYGQKKTKKNEKISYLLLSWVNEDRIFRFVWTTPLRLITNQPQYYKITMCVSLQMWYIRGYFKKQLPTIWFLPFHQVQSDIKAQ